MKNRPARMRYMTRYCAAFILAILPALFSCREKKQTVPVEETRIELKEKNKDFGNITEGEKVSHTFHFKNTGSNNLIISKVETGCGCTAADYGKAPIPPGKDGKIEVVFNSAGRYGKQYKEISIFANIPGGRATLCFTANVKAK